MRKRGSDTSCAAAGSTEPYHLNDRHAEEVILAGLMHDPDETFAGLMAVKFKKDDLYWDHCQTLYDVLLYTLHGGGVPRPDTVYLELRHRKGWVNGDRCGTAVLLADVWFADWWLSDMTKWADIRHTHTGDHAWAALAAAAKVQHLSARRQAIHAANELIRDALSPTGDADSLKGRTDTLNEEF